MGTETSKYLQERKSTETPKVVASEIGPADCSLSIEQKEMESSPQDGDRPVCEEMIRLH